jgi:voltage-gated potassium channel
VQAAAPVLALAAARRTIVAMDATPATPIRPGQPRSQAAAASLDRYEHRIRLPIIASALLPLIIVPESNGWVGVLVGVVTWLVFLVDYVVHHRNLDHYGGTWRGRFDLFVVLATAPWFLLPGLQAGEFVVALRLARLVRLVAASKGSRRLFERLGRVAILAVVVLVIASFVAYHAEHRINPEFATVGDAMWWGLVTLTTVGYGDIVPITTTGRWAGATIMITGIAVLGTLAGSLASFFRVDEPDPKEESEPETPSNDTGLAGVTAEVAALRRQIEVLTERLALGNGNAHDQ